MSIFSPAMPEGNAVNGEVVAAQHLDDSVQFLWFTWRIVSVGDEKWVDELHQDSLVVLGGDLTVGYLQIFAAVEIKPSC